MVCNSTHHLVHQFTLAMNSFNKGNASNSIIDFIILNGYFKQVFRACLHGRGGLQIGQVTCGESPHLSCKRDEVKMRDCMERRVTPAKRVTSPTWGPPPPCKRYGYDCIPDVKKPTALTTSFLLPRPCVCQPECKTEVTFIIIITCPDIKI